MAWEETVAADGSAVIGAVLVDLSSRIIDLTDGVLQESGMDRQELVGRSAIDLVHPDDIERAAMVLDEGGEIPGQRPEGMYRLKLADGTHRHFAIRAKNIVLDEVGDAIVIEFSEPTTQIRAQAFADDAVDALRMLSEDINLDESLDWVARVAERHEEGLQIVITLFEENGANRVFSRSAVRQDILDTNRTAKPELLPIHVEVAYVEFQQRQWRSSQKIASLDFIVPGRLTSILAGRDGKIVGYVEALRTTIDAPDDFEWLVHGMISRMMTAALHRYEFDRQLRRAADLDPLTGLLNRRRLFEVLAEQDDLTGSLLYLIDLDRFSWVNNNLGHQAGDETLIGIADALVQVCPPEAKIARLGGDEFVVWVPISDDPRDLRALGDQISKAMVVPAGAGDKRVWVRGSIGMVGINPGEAAADALHRADIAMYASKRSGGDIATLG